MSPEHSGFPKLNIIVVVLKPKEPVKSVTPRSLKKHGAFEGEKGQRQRETEGPCEIKASDGPDS